MIFIIFFSHSIDGGTLSSHSKDFFGGGKKNLQKHPDTIYLLIKRTKKI